MSITQNAHVYAVHLVLSLVLILGKSSRRRVVPSDPPCQAVGFLSMLSSALIVPLFGLGVIFKSSV